MSWFSIIKPPFWDHPDAPENEHVSYRRMWKTNFSVAVAATLAPIMLLAGLGFFQMNWLDDMERAHQRRKIEARLNSGRLCLADRLKERTASLKMAAGLISHQGKGLAEALEILNRSFGGFAALALVGPKANLVRQAGDWSGLLPKAARLTGEGFTGGLGFFGAGEQPGWNGGFLAGVRLSGREDNLRLLALVSGQDMQRAANAARPWPQSQTWLVDARGRAQASVGGTQAPPQPEEIKNLASGGAARVVRARDSAGRPVLLGRARVEGFPLWLVSQTPLSSLPGPWEGLKLPFVILMALFILSLLIMIYKATMNQVTRLYRAHLEQAQVLREIVYTQKLASIGRLASGVGHQINNPVSVINEKAGLLKDLLTYRPDELDPERLIALVENIEDMVRRIGTITHRLLGFAKHLPVEVASLDLAVMLREVADFLVSDAKDRDITVEFDMPDSGSVIESDRSLMEQVLLNICNNAVGAVEHGGHINISLEDKGEQGVTIRVADDGRGIPPEHLEHIFEPYFTTKGEMGCGLGLSITYGIVQKLGGGITVENIEGAGALVTVSLPRRAPLAPPARQEDRQASKGSPAPSQNETEA